MGLPLCADVIRQYKPVVEHFLWTSINLRKTKWSVGLWCDIGFPWVCLCVQMKLAKASSSFCGLYFVTSGVLLLSKAARQHSSSNNNDTLI